MTATGRNTSQPLTGKQLRAVDLLAAGSSDRETAEAVAIDRVTVWRWQRHDAFFQAALNARRAEVWESARDGLRSLLPRAIGVLGKAMEAGDSQAALALLKLAGVGDLDLGRTGPVDAEVIAERDRQELARREREAAEEEVRAAQHSADLDLQRAFAGLPSSGQ